ncbi:formate dehydrogenase subunit alpha [Pirellulales bacterium]|nr:formate dehydrogenase subunit alpha [Pirellulales bacterium]
MRSDVTPQSPQAELIMRATINGCTADFRSGTSILDAAAELGVEIPTLCRHADLSSVGSCRLCTVEIEGRRDLTCACTEVVSEGMRVTTESATLAESRRSILEMLLANYVEYDQEGTTGVETEFKRWVRHYGAQPPKDRPPERRHSVDADPNPFIRVDLNKCILCTRCVRACEELQGRFVWGVGGRGEETKIIAGLDTNLLDARCESCGACAAYCPTGALADRMSYGQSAPDRLVRTTCGYCGVGCQFDLNVKDERVVAVTSSPSAPVNGMSLCVKGRYGHDFLHHRDRLTRPKVRRYLLDGVPPAKRPPDRGPWVGVDWDTATNLAAKQLVAIKRESGPDALGFLSSAKCTNEENYLVQKLARQLFRTNNVDHCARLCHSSTVAGLAMAFGSGAMSNSMDDIANHAKAILVIGSNTTEQHPVFGAMLRQSVLHRNVKLVVADPRKIDLTEFAAIHLRQRPGTDVALVNGLMHLALRNGWHDEDFIRSRCEGFDQFRETVDAYTPERVCRITGIAESQLYDAAELLCNIRPMAVIWAMGITQHTTGVINVLSLANLQMLLGNIGLPGGGVNPLRGQNNVQGACDMGALPNVLPGYQSVADATVRAKFSTAWALEGAASNVASRDLFPATPGLTVTELIEAAGAGAVRGLYILGEDPAMTEPDVNHVHKCLEQAEFIVLQEIFPSETSRWADVLLPGAAFAEKNGTFTNTDRRIQPIRTAINPPGSAEPDWLVLRNLGEAVVREDGLAAQGEWSAWNYDSPAEILTEIAALTPSYGGVMWSRIESGERLQWPVPTVDHPGTPILHIESFTRGKGRFHAVDHLPPEELPDEDFPLLLTTGRVLYHWHGGELTRRSAGLLAAYPGPIVELSPEDAAKSKIAAGDAVRVASRRGELLAQAVVTDRVPSGVVFGTFHFPGSGNVNNLTNCALDPTAKIPEYKVCAVQIAVV